MKNLTEKELIFWNALIEDYQINKEKSFIECLFLGALIDKKEMKEELEELFEGSYNKLFNNSDLLMFSVNSCYIGKYKDTFWGTGSEGEIFGLGKEIQSIVFPIIYSQYGQVTDLDEKISVCEYFKNHLNLDYDDYINTYKNFCKNLGYEYKEDLNLISQQSEDFEKELEELK